MTESHRRRVCWGTTERSVRHAEQAEQALVMAASEGDVEALRGLWDANRRWVAAVLLAHKPRQAELEDLLQEVAAVVVARIGEVREVGAFRGWLRTVAINAARTGARRERSARARLLERLGAERRAEAHRVATAAADHEAPALEEGRRLLELAERLPASYREPLLLRCVRGMSYRQIATVLALPETTVENRIVRGRRMLRELAEADRRTRPGGAASAAGTCGGTAGEETAAETTAERTAERTAEKIVGSQP